MKIKIVLACTIFSFILSASDYYKEFPFGEGKRARSLEKLTTGKWWTRKPKDMHQKFIAER